MNFTNLKRYFFLPGVYFISFIFIFSSIAQAADIQAQGKVLNEAREEAYARWQAEQEGINANVYGVRSKQQLNRISEWPQQLQWKQSFFISSVGMNKNTYSHKDKTQDSNNYAVSHWQTWEKITDQAGYENSFADIIKGFGNEFNFTITHLNEVYHAEGDTSIGEIHGSSAQKFAFIREDGRTGDRREFTQDTFNIHAYQ